MVLKLIKISFCLLVSCLIKNKSMDTLPLIKVYFTNFSSYISKQNIFQFIDKTKVNLQTRPPPLNIEHKGRELWIITTQRGNRINITTKEYIGFTTSEIKQTRELNQLQIKFFIACKDDKWVKEIFKINKLQPDECIACNTPEEMYIIVVELLKNLS